MALFQTETILYKTIPLAAIYKSIYLASGLLDGKYKYVYCTNGLIGREWHQRVANGRHFVNINHQSNTHFIHIYRECFKNRILKTLIPYKDQWFFFNLSSENEIMDIKKLSL